MIPMKIQYVLYLCCSRITNLRYYDTCENTHIAPSNTAVVCCHELHCLLLGICHQFLVRVRREE